MLIVCTLHAGLQASDLPRSLVSCQAVKGIAAGPRTSRVTGPDGYRPGLVQWPAGHADGITKADFA